MKKFLLNLLKKQTKNEKGLTLVELLAVIVILAIVSAIAVPAIGGIIDNTRYKAVKSDAINVINAANLYFTDNQNATTVDVPTLMTAGFLESSGNIPNTVNSTISNASTPISLTTGVIDYGGDNDTKFTGATLSEINAHNLKTDTIIGD